MNCSTHPIPVTYPATHSLTAPRRPAGRGTSTLELRLRQASHNRVNPQVTCALAGHLAWISKPSADSIYNMRSITDSGFFKTLDTATHIGDKGYIKPGIIAPPSRNPPMAKSPAKAKTTRPATVSAISSNESSRASQLGEFTRTDYRHPYNTLQAITKLTFAYTP